MSPTSIAIADAKFGIMVGITAIISTSSFFFIVFSFVINSYFESIKTYTQHPLRSYTHWHLK